MKTFKELYEACCAACEKRAEIEEVKEPTGDLKDACWKGYTAVGMKMKNGRKVPNCVPVKEEVEQIDEVSKKTLNRYVSKARDSEKTHRAYSYRYHGYGGEGHTPDYEEDEKDERKAEKREAGIALARSKMNKKGTAKIRATEEFEQIDELSTNTVKSYLDKVRFKQGRSVVQMNMGTPGMKKKHAAELDKTEKSMNLARNRLTKENHAKEEFQIDESYMMAAAASANQPKYTERTAEQEKKHAERKAEKYLHMPGKNAAKKRKYWVKKVNKLHGIPEETQKGKNVVPPHVGALATGGIVKEEEGENKPLGKVMRAGDGKKKFKVYVKNAKGNVVKVGFGDPNMEIKRDDPERRKNFRARHNCDTANDRTTPRYWSCRQWRAGAKVEA